MMKLEPSYIEFIFDLINSSQNIELNLINLTDILLEHFNLSKKSISPYALYRLLKKRKYVYKKIIWKKPKDNELTTKNIRKELQC